MFLEALDYFDNGIFRLLAEEAAEHAAGFFLEIVDDVALEAVEVHVFEKAVGVKLGDDLAYVEVLKVDALECVCHLCDVEVIAEVLLEVGDDLLDVHGSVFFRVNDYSIWLINA